MNKTEHANKLNIKIKEKGDVYQELLNKLLNNPPNNTGELFKLKRNLITLARETRDLISEYNNIGV